MNKKPDILFLNETWLTEKFIEEFNQIYSGKYYLLAN